jgi:hypothetical protein
VPSCRTCGSLTRIWSNELVGVTAVGQGKVHSNKDDPTGRHPGKTEAVSPKALNESADLVGQSYRERHRGQRALCLHNIARTYGRTAPVWVYGSKFKRAP